VLGDPLQLQGLLPDFLSLLLRYKQEESTINFQDSYKKLLVQFHAKETEANDSLLDSKDDIKLVTEYISFWAVYWVELFGKAHIDYIVSATSWRGSGYIQVSDGLTMYIICFHALLWSTTKSLPTSTPPNDIECISGSQPKKICQQPIAPGHMSPPWPKGQHNEVKLPLNY
jgi:hypothetical protein